MFAFVVITEDYYGGENNLKVFKQKINAQQFADTITNDLERFIFETALPTISNSNKVFVTVTEEWFGGGIDKIRLFQTQEEAEQYGLSINENGNLDTIALERLVE
jgi:hypothetical protein